MLRRFLKNFRFYRRKRPGTWFYVYDTLLRKCHWVHRDWLWTHEFEHIKEKYNRDFKLIEEWRR